MNTRAQPLVNGTPEFPICEIPMDSSFRDSPEILDCCHVSSLKWTVLVVSRFCDLRPPVTQILCQFESEVSKLSMDSQSLPRVLHGWMVQIVLGLRQVRSQNAHLPLLFPDVQIPKMGDLVTCVLP